MNDPRGTPGSDFLAELEAAFLAAGPTPQRWTALEAARARADALAPSDPGPAGRQLAVIVFLAEALAANALENALGRAEFTSLMETGAEVAGVSVDAIERAIYLLVVRHPNLAQLPPQVSLDTQLALLCSFTHADWAAVWQTRPNGVLECIAAVGEHALSDDAQAEARHIVEGGANSPREGVQGLPVTRWPQPNAALVIGADATHLDRAVALAAEAANVVGVILERDSLVRRSAGREQTLVGLTERRFTRLGFDLHDGPLQDAAALAAEIRHFRKQLPRLLEAPDPLEIAAGRFDDLEARVVALDRDLRELARSFESPAVLKRPFAEAVREEVNSLTRSTSIEARVGLEGDFHRLTDSQRIALFRIVQEALTNVREHSRAKTVSVGIVERRGNVELEIVDDGHGFDVESRLLEAARRGHLGVVGMNERVRLLGGVFTLQSQRGGPTTISVSLPAWRPIAGEEDESSPARADVADDQS